MARVALARESRARMLPVTELDDLRIRSTTPGSHHGGSGEVVQTNDT
jgi:hypothetical protein